jgi:U3 small nucleolar RNA-associated protein 11
LKEKERKNNELAVRKDRVEKLSAIKDELEMQKLLTKKGTKKKIGVDSRGLAVYKWSSRRKK